MFESAIFQHFGCKVLPPGNTCISCLRKNLCPAIYVGAQTNFCLVMLIAKQIHIEQSSFTMLV